MARATDETRDVQAGSAATGRTADAAWFTWRGGRGKLPHCPGSLPRPVAVDFPNARQRVTQVLSRTACSKGVLIHSFLFLSSFFKVPRQTPSKLCGAAVANWQTEWPARLRRRLAMPAKLKFRVVQCSSEDPEFPSTELNAHSPHTVGWQSARFCDFPQEIGFQFAGPVHLVQLQVLSHQYKIASKLELFVGTCPDGDKISYQKCKWKRLGYLSLDNNERSSWQARELKSVQLDAYGRFLKIVAHSCHTNKLNMYSQIGLIAINLIGDAVSSGAPAPQGAPAGKETPGTRKEISALDDLTFDLNFDPATAAQIRELHVAKERAVRAEDYDAAKRLKEAMERLKQVGARMAKLELRKKAAVDNEDYDTAKLIKAEMDKLRAGLSYASDHHAGDPRSVAGGSGAMAGAGGHRPANVVVEEEDVRPGGGGGGGSPYVKNPFGNKAGFVGGGPGGAGGSGHSPSHHSPPPAHNQAYSPEGGEGRGGYDDGYQTPARGGMAVGGQASMPSPSQSGLPDDKAAGHLGVQGGGAMSNGMSNSPYNMAQGSPAVGGGLYGGGASGGGANVEEAARDRETGMAQGPRRILDPDARQVRAGPPNPAAESTDLTNDKAALAAAQSEGGPGPPEELTGAAIAEAEPIAEMYGMDVAKMVLSKYWQHRVEGLEEIQKQLVGGGNGARPARVVAAVLKRAIADKNPTVVLSSFQLLNAMLNLTDESGKKLELKGLLDTTLQGAVWTRLS